MFHWLPSLGVFCAFMSSVAWAIGSASYSKLTKTYSPFRINFTRALVSIPLMTLTSFLSEGWSAYSSVTGTHVQLLVISILCSYALGDSLFFLSTLSIGISGALAIASSYPIGLALIRALIEEESFSLIQILGLVLSVLGVIAVILTDPKKANIAPKKESRSPLQKKLEKKSVGIALGLVTSFCWAANSYTVGKASLELHAAVANTIRMGAALLTIILFYFFRTKKLVSPLPWITLKPIIWVFILEAFGGSFFFAYGLSHTPMVVGGVLTSLAPVLVVPVAILLRLEKFSWSRTLAIFTIVLGISLLMQPS